MPVGPRLAPSPRARPAPERPAKSRPRPPGRAATWLKALIPRFAPPGPPADLGPERPPFLTPAPRPVATEVPEAPAEPAAGWLVPAALAAAAVYLL